MVIVGGGPVGLVLALMLARREIASEVLDARALEAAQADRRLLALSRGTLQLLRPLAALPPAVTAPIRRVHVSSAGEFGRVELGNDDGEPEPLGLTIRYGDLLAPLAEACSRSELVTVSRPSRVTAIRQQPARAVVQLDDGTSRDAQIVVNAEGLGAQPPASAPTQCALLADVTLQGPAAGSAFERFTRDGPLALLPLPGAVDAGRAMGLVWCMPPEAAARRTALGDPEFLAELQSAFGARNGKISARRAAVARTAAPAGARIAAGASGRLPGQRRPDTASGRRTGLQSRGARLRVAGGQPRSGPGRAARLRDGARRLRPRPTRRPRSDSCADA